MGMAPLFCCFNKQNPNCIALTGLIASVLAFVFLIWGLSDLEFKRNGVKAIYVISYIFIILIMLAMIAFLVFLNLRKSTIYRTLMNIGRIICLVILILAGISFLLMLIAFIILLVDYGKLSSYLKDVRNEEIDEDEDGLEYLWAIALDNVMTEAKIAGHEWGAVIVPSIISLIALIVIAFVANALYKVFVDNYNSAEPVSTNSNQNTMVTVIPNNKMPGMFQNNNNISPLENNVNYPVTVQQTGGNFK